jgi:hypothetical protein
MCNTTENLGDSTTGSSLYCVWVPVHDEGGDRLVSIWIDRALTAFEAQMQEGTYETCTTVTTQAEHVEIAVTGVMQEPAGKEGGICKDV